MAKKNLRILNTCILQGVQKHRFKLKHKSHRFEWDEKADIHPLTSTWTHSIPNLPGDNRKCRLSSWQWGMTLQMMTHSGWFKEENQSHRGMGSIPIGIYLSIGPTWLNKILLKLNIKYVIFPYLLLKYFCFTNWITCWYLKWSLVWSSTHPNHLPASHLVNIKY